MLTGDGKALRRSVIGLTFALIVTLLLLVAQIAQVIRERRAAAPERSAASVPAIPPRPIGSPGASFGRDSYPSGSLKRGEEGRAVVSLTINRRGRVRRCRVTSSSGYRALDRRTCRVARRLRFEPARDAAGDAVRSTYTLPVRWTLDQR